MRSKRSPTHPTVGTPRSAHRVYEEKPGKLPDLAVCPRCRASYRNGRWTWQPAPVDAYEHTCPACERVASDYPAGVVHLRGAFAQAHRDDLVRLLRNVEERECAEHPLKRIIGVSDEENGFAVSVTDGKLAESLGRALKRAHEGRLEHPATTSEKQNLVRVHWIRD